MLRSEELAPPPPGPLNRPAGIAAYAPRPIDIAVRLAPGRPGIAAPPELPSPGAILDGPHAAVKFSIRARTARSHPPRPPWQPGLERTVFRNLAQTDGTRQRESPHGRTLALARWL